MTSTDTPVSPARRALDALTNPPPGVVGSIDHAAFDAAFPGLPAGMTEGEARRRVRAAVAAAEPLIVDDVVSRLLRGAKDTTTEWTVRIHYTDGSDPSVGGPTSRKSAELGAEGVNAAVSDPGYRRRWDAALSVAGRAEVVTRQVVTLRDGSVFTSPWVTSPTPEGN